MIRRFVKSDHENCSFKFDKMISDNSGEKWTNEGLFTVDLSEVPMTPAISVEDISEMGSYSAVNGINCLLFLTMKTELSGLKL